MELEAGPLQIEDVDSTIGDRSRNYPVVVAM